MPERKAHECVRCHRRYWQEDMRLCLQMPGAPLHPGAGPFQPRPSPDSMLWVCRRGRGCRTYETWDAPIALGMCVFIAVVVAVMLIGRLGT